MTQAGGPAAINGFLYQILHHIGWLADISLSASFDGHEVQDAILVLEPRAGGDASATMHGGFVVEQYKSRKDGTWAIDDIVQVLRDLRKAVPVPLPAAATYRFVTDGRPGRLEPLFAFLAELKTVASPDELSEDKRSFGGDMLSNKEFFDVVARVTRPNGPGAQDERSVLVHLLRGFEFVFGSDGEGPRVESLLRRYVPDLGDERAVRERLVGRIVETLAKGEARFDLATVDVLLREVGVSTERVRRFANAVGILSALSRNRLAKMGYRPRDDVRPAPQWVAHKHVLLLAGRSGVGKTWQVGGMLEELARNGELATIVLSPASREEAMRDAARDLWQFGLGETSEKNLVGVSLFLRELAPNSDAARVTIVVDDVRDADMARALVRQDWDELNMRLVMSVPLMVARALEQTDADVVQVALVSDFSVDELDRLLTLKQRRWAELPADLKKLLVNPMLAGLFLSLPIASILKAPRTEYEIFERVWDRIAARSGAGDEGLVTALADQFIEGKPYPLVRSAWSSIGLDGTSMTRLEAAGWLTVDERGCAAFAHDRLLNWAAARALATKHALGDLTTNELVSIVSGTAGLAPDRQQRLGYLAMDLVWLQTAQRVAVAETARLVAGMAETRTFGSYGELLYTQLLPTLGQNAVPVLLALLRSAPEGGVGDYRITLIERSFAALAVQDNVDLADVMTELLGGNSLNEHRVAIAALTSRPDPARLDRLWEIHRKRLIEHANAGPDADLRPRQASIAAVRAAVQLQPEWLRNRLETGGAAGEPLWELAYVLNGLQHPDAPLIWRDCRDLLIAGVPFNKVRGVLLCIARFKDRSQVALVARYVSQSEDLAGLAALNALTVIDPITALTKLAEADDAALQYGRENWLPGLLRAQPAATRRTLLELAQKRPDGHRFIEAVFASRPSDLDIPLLEFLLGALKANLKRHLGAGTSNEPRWLHFPLALLAGISKPELLKVLWAEAGGELETQLVAVARARLDTNSRNWDHALEDVRTVLLLIGGAGLTTLIVEELRSPHYWVRHRGLLWASARNEPEVVSALADIARRDVPRDGTGKVLTDPYLEFHQATSALAALGADSMLIDVLQNNVVPELPEDLADLRAHCGPMPLVLTRTACETLRSGSAAEAEALVATVIIGMSGDQGLIPILQDALRAAQPEDVGARFACSMLQRLGDRSDDFAWLCLGLARTKSNAHWGIHALIAMGEKGAERLLEWQQAPGDSPRVALEPMVIGALHEHPSTRAWAAAAAVRYCDAHPGMLGDLVEIAAEEPDETLREQILYKAFVRESFVVTDPLHAIAALSKFDPRRAAEAGGMALRFHPKLQNELCQLLVRMAPEDVEARLIDAAIAIDRPLLTQAIGRALRRADARSAGAVLRGRMVASTKERTVAAELAGWLPAEAGLLDALAALADGDESGDVRRAALRSLQRRDEETRIGGMITSFRDAGYDRRWSLLTAILGSADARTMLHPDDVLSLEGFLGSDVPAIFHSHAVEVLKHRRKEEK